MTMNDYMHRDHLRELWMHIDKLHLSYLQTDESPYRIEQRNKLENYIREYLCIAPHDRKFCFRETANILHQSATLKDGFSAYRAASAWNALGLYAANLLSQPWRKEYRVLKMYCGFYKHEVEANLVGAEVMLEAMGYKHVGNTTMVLDGPIDPDRVSNVSRDSLMAAVECQLLKIIWEEISCRFQCRWIEILEFRENHVCTPENAVKGLMYQYHQREYQEQHQHQQHQLAMYHQPSDNYGTSRFHQPTPSCLYGQMSPTIGSIPPHIGYYNYSPYAVSSPHAYTLPSQPRYGTVMSPQQPAMPYPVGPPAHPSYLPAPLHSILKSQDLYPTNGHGTIHQYATPGPVAAPHIPPHPVQGMQMTLQNGYTIQNQLTPAQTTGPNYGCLVPTGQLIELDAAPPSCSSETQHTFSATDSSGSVLIPRTVRQHQSHQSKKSSVEKRDTYSKLPEGQAASYVTSTSKNEQTAKKTKDEGTGTFESWDYVFRNLESQGYNKDLGERPDILSPVDSHHVNAKSVALERNPRRSEPDALDLEDALMEMRLEEMQRKVNSSEPRTMKINEALQKIKLDSDAELMRTKNQGASDLVDCSVSVYDNMSSSPKETNTKQRPVIVDSSKCNVGTTKISTKTLPRESRKHGGESKRLVASNSNYSTATLDPRQLSERPLVSNTSEITDAQVHEKSSIRKNSIGKSKLSDVTVDRKEYLGNTSFYPDEMKTKWECVTCTFHNDVSRDICEMCGKSKVRGSESRPLASGGRECPQCTLVNEKDVGTCVACDCSLKDSPTYI